MEQGNFFNVHIFYELISFSQTTIEWVENVESQKVQTPQIFSEMGLEHETLSLNITNAFS